MTTVQTAAAWLQGAMEVPLRQRRTVESPLRRLAAVADGWEGESSRTLACGWSWSRRSVVQTWARLLVAPAAAACSGGCWRCWMCKAVLLQLS